jgi:PAS domain S-box-containing protein
MEGVFKMDFFKEIFETAGLPIVVYNLKTLAIVHVNRAAENFYGYCKDELLSLKFSDISSCDLSHRGAYECEHTMKDGSKKPVETYFSPLESKKNHAYITLRDKTNEHEGYNEFLKDYDRYKHAIEGAYDGLWDWNLITNEAYHSERFETILGYNPGELPETYVAWVENLHPDDKEAALKRAHDFMDGKTKTYNSDFRLRKKDGSYIWIKGRGKLIKNEQGIPVRFVGSNQDISETIKLQENLKKKKELLEKIYKNAPVMIYVKNFSGEYVMTNDSFRKFFDLKKDDIKNGLKSSSIIDAEAAKEVEEIDKNVLHSKKSITIRNQKVVNKDGVVHYLNLTKVLLNPDLPLEQREVLGIGVDVSEYVDMERRLGELNTLLKDGMNKERCDKESAQAEVKEKDALLLQQSKMALMGEMVGMIAHQWKQPLSVISMVAQNISDYLEFDSDKEMLEMTEEEILKQVAYMSETINSFRNFFKPSKQKIPFLVHKNIQETLVIMEHGFDSKGISVEVVCDEELFVYGYPNEFKQVLMTLLANAKDALVEKRTQKPLIKISTFKKDGFINILLEDNAGGIDEEILPTRLFDPYVSTKGDDGTGIGLMIAKKIVTGMGGSIEAYNSEIGACFLIKIELYSEMMEIKR